MKCLMMNHDHHKTYSPEMHKYGEHHSSSKMSYSTDRACEKLIEIMTNPPATWAEHMDQPGGTMKILDMEIAQMKQAYLAMKSETGTHSDFTEELTHVMAAAAHAWLTMTCASK